MNTDTPTEEKDALDILAEEIEKEDLSDVDTLREILLSFVTTVGELDGSHEVAIEGFEGRFVAIEEALQIAQIQSMGTIMQACHTVLGAVMTLTTPPTDEIRQHCQQLQQAIEQAIGAPAQVQE